MYNEQSTKSTEVIAWEA